MISERALKASIGAVAVASLLAPPAIAKDAPEPIRLKPSSKWHVEFADDSCRLARFFGDGDQKTLFYIERYEPGDRFSMVAAGEPFKRWTRRSEVMVRFGPTFEENEWTYALGNVGEHKPALIFSYVRFDGPEEDSDDDDESEGLEAVADVFGQTVTPEAEKEVSWIQLRYRKNRPSFLRPDQWAMR